MTDRNDFLKSMYEQMFRDIDQHYTIVWQSAGTVFASFAIIALSEKQLIPIDLGVSILVIVFSWLFLNVIECSYWYNRNLCIIANIERQFLTKADLKDIHYYFGKHRPNNRMNSYLETQAYLGGILAILVLLYHFIARVLPNLSQPWTSFDPLRSLPYVMSAAALLVILRRHRHRLEDYNNFVRESPGIPVDTTGVTYGGGHGYPRTKPD